MRSITKTFSKPNQKKHAVTILIALLLVIVIPVLAASLFKPREKAQQAEIMFVSEPMQYGEVVLNGVIRIDKPMRQTTASYYLVLDNNNLILLDYATTPNIKDYVNKTVSVSGTLIPSQIDTFVGFLTPSSITIQH